MQKIIGVRFKKAGKIHFFDPGEDDIQSGDCVIVETARGLECGDVVIGVREIPVSENPDCPNVQLPNRIYRKATPDDLARVAENRIKEKKAFDICQEKILEHELPMNLINVNYTFDMSKIIFYFTAEGRVDFRALVRDLAYIFHTRIELRQVGVRDEAKLLGGVGCCGRPLCCANFLGDFAPVSIRMAKEQNLSLNPTKISGICGRLLCCLKYESDYYHENYIEQAKNYEPKQGDRVILENGKTGKIVALNEVRRNATILVDRSKETVVTGWETLLPLDNGENITQIVEDNISDVEEEFEPPPKPAPKPVQKPVQKPERPKNIERKKNPNRPEDSRAANLFDNRPKEKVNKKNTRQNKNPKGRKK
ncbi:MAG: stage 0 sporulation family protein [Selenomonadaceae bacterium]|nr:stage 0 sporulation family protein [Selenomonadaceae bacterium]